MPFESVPDDLVALRYPIGDGEEPIRTIKSSMPSAGEVIGAAFRQGNFLVSAAASGNQMYKPEPKYSLLNDIADTHYLLDYGDEFIGSRSSAETKAIIARIDREIHDKQTLAAGGWFGTVAGVGAGLFDPLSWAPGGALYKSAKGAKLALSLASAAAVGTVVQETGLHATQTTRTLEESIFNIGSATVLAGLIDCDSGVARGPLLGAVDRLVAAGDIEAAAAMLTDNAMARRDSIIDAMAAANLPPHTAAVPFAGTCLEPLLQDGDIVTVDPFADIEQGDITMFSIEGEEFHYAKVFLGVTDCPRMKTALGYDIDGTAAAVFWMANPDKILTVPLADVSYIAKVTGRIDDVEGYQAFPAWPHDGFKSDEVIRYGDSLQSNALEAFGHPPLVLARA
jgi:Peptidase S24-like